MGPLRSGTHLVLGSGRFPSFEDLRRLRGDHGTPGARGVRVFAAEPDAVQLDWAALGPGPVSIRIADTVVEVMTDGGPGVVDLTGLPANRALVASLTGDGVPRRASPTGRIDLTVKTPAPPPGDELARIATISDSHIGETTFGYLHTIGEPRDTPRADAHPVRAIRAAVDAAVTWGAQRLVCKGDIVDQSHPGNWADAIDALGNLDVPVHLIPGNHEVKRRRSIDPGDALAGSTIAFTTGVDLVELGGASLVLVDSTVPDHERGELRAVLGAFDSALSRSQGSTLVAMHHHLVNGRSPRTWPVGVPRDQADEFLEHVVRIHPNTMVTSGHVHRNRLRWHGTVPVTCVGSVKDYPGVWAGYVFHEGGMRQVIRRVGEPSVLRWTERTGDALGGLYRYWTPSTLERRCVSVVWPGRSG